MFEIRAILLDKFQSDGSGLYHVRVPEYQSPASLFYSIAFRAYGNQYSSMSDSLFPYVPPYKTKKSLVCDRSYIFEKKQQDLFLSCAGHDRWSNSELSNS